MMINVFRGLVGLAVASVLVCSHTPAAFGQTTYSGDAYDVGAAIDVTAVVSVTATVNNVGPLPPTGGSSSSTLVNANLTGLLTTGIVTASTSGAGGIAQSVATVDNLSILPLSTIALTASVVTANSEAISGSAFGSSTITGLVFAGNAITVTGAPNQIVFATDILGQNIAELIINQQIPVTIGTDNQITVNALDLELLGGAGSIGSGDVIISSAESNLTPGVSGSGGAGTPEPSTFAYVVCLGVASTVVLRRRRRA